MSQQNNSGLSDEKGLSPYSIQTTSVTSWYDNLYYDGNTIGTGANTTITVSPSSAGYYSYTTTFAATVDHFYILELFDKKIPQKVYIDGELKSIGIIKSKADCWLAYKNGKINLIMRNLYFCGEKQMCIEFSKKIVYLSVCSNEDSFSQNNNKSCKLEYKIISAIKK